MEKYLALLRGINVGGKNLIKMAVLKQAFEASGFDHVTTYIQSGNVIFQTSKQSLDQLTKKIELSLLQTFGLHLTLVVLNRNQLIKVVKAAPKNFGVKPELYRYDVIFLKPPLEAKKIIKEIPIKPGVDQVKADNGVLYFARRFSQLSKSKLSKISLLPAYKSMTIRNWKTTTKLLALME